MSLEAGDRALDRQTAESLRPYGRATRESMGKGERHHPGGKKPLLNELEAVIFK